jgi:hypothetical protein
MRVWRSDVVAGWGAGARRASIAAALAAIVLGSVRIPVAAQALEFGGGFSRLKAPDLFLGPDDCTGGNAWAGEGVIALRFTSIVALEATTAYNWSNPERCERELPTIPPSGEFSHTFQQSAGGYPFVTTDFRIMVESPEPHQSAWLRAFGGYGRMWSRNIGYWLAGGGLALAGRLTPILEAEWNWFSVPFEELTLNYVDGVLVRTDTVSGSKAENTFRVRAGLRWRLR